MRKPFAALLKRAQDSHLRKLRKLSRAVGAVGPNQELIHGGFRLVFLQLVAVAATVLYKVPVSWLILKVLDLTIGLSVTSDDPARRIGLQRLTDRAHE